MIKRWMHHLDIQWMRWQLNIQINMFENIEWEEIKIHIIVILGNVLKDISIVCNNSCLF